MTLKTLNYFIKLFDQYNDINFQRSYRLETNKALAQNPSANAKTLMEIANSNTGLNFDQNGERSPDEYAAYCGIHNYDEKHNSIMQLFFDNLHPDQHISSLITTLKALGSL